MRKTGKKFEKSAAKVDRGKRYPLAEACKLVPETKVAKFDETVDIAVRLGVDPKHADQMVRGAVVLPAKVYRPKVRDYAAEERLKEKGKKPGEIYRPAFTAQYDLKGQTDDDILLLLKMAKKKRRPIRFSYRVPKSKDYPNGVISSSPINVSKLDAAGLLDLIQEMRQKSADALGKRGRLVRMRIN